MTENIHIRQMRRSDIPELARLMRAIVEFEGDSDFLITEADLLQRGFGEHPEFPALVADTGNDQLAGIAVYYTIPFMHNLKLQLMLKWLYLDSDRRGKNIGRRLIGVLSEHALRHGYAKFSWFVLSNNLPAQQFYRSLGAKPDDKWIRWTISPEQVHTPADDEKR